MYLGNHLILHKYITHSNYSFSSTLLNSLPSSTSKIINNTMAGVLNVSQLSILPSLPGQRKTPRSLASSIRASSDTPLSSTPSETATTQEEKKLETTFAPPPNFKVPEPKTLGVRPDKKWDVRRAGLALPLRFFTGFFTSGYSASFVSKDDVPPSQYAFGFSGFKVIETSKLGPRPEKPIEIYEFEGSPFCRKVREISSVLDLDVMYYPSPKGGPTFRPKVAQIGGKLQFPYMVDPNTGVSMYESDDIIKYLVGNYGDGNVPWMLSLGPLTNFSEGFALIARKGKGSFYTPSKVPPKPLVLWAYEGSPFCKLVREVLVELELPHLCKWCARGSPKRQILYEKVGHFQVPYLEDPNTGVQMFESAEIVDYLRATYAQ